MEVKGEIEIRVSGTQGNRPLTPDNFDIREIISILENVPPLVFQGDKKQRPIITYQIEEGSVRNLFKVPLQYVASFNAILGLIVHEQSIDILDLPTANAIENFQALAKKKDYKIDITTSIDNAFTISIDKNSNFERSEVVWAEAEFYFYGKVTNAGGKDKANIHLLTEEYGTIRIQTPIRILEQQEENILYKTLGIRAKGKQNTQNGEIDFSDLNFIEMIDYSPIYDEEYLKELRDKAKKSWITQINPDEWLENIRGNYER